MNATDTSALEEPSFEERLEELKTLVEELEAGDLSLEDMLQRYEQGMSLIATCQDRLERAQLRITEIAASGDDR
ncbi:MAG TPA: exodeoxyribonuclease VII small subunit [Thermomicrobiales bacterium]|nr:exodeoxyribonuclease VII small subunit [Thermomicrobiales bacterium]